MKEKLIFTFLMLVLFRFGIHLPVFGINNEIFARIASGNNILGFLDLFSGGALGKVSIFALGIGPYITSSIIMQLMAVIIPTLEKLQKEGYWVYALEAGGEDIYKEDFKGSVALVVGGEDSGVKRLTKEKCDKILSIPLQGQVNSLNASVALGIAAYEVVRNRLQ